MLFYSIPNSDDKTYDWKKILPIFNLPFCTKEIPCSAHRKINKL